MNELIELAQTYPGACAVADQLPLVKHFTAQQCRDALVMNKPGKVVTLAIERRLRALAKTSKK